MQLAETEKYSLPGVAAPFATVARISSHEGLPDRNRPHYHPDTVELCAVIRGQLDWFVGEETFVVRPGEVVAVPAGAVHGALDEYLQPCEVIGVHFAPEQLPSSLGSALNDLGPRRMRHQPLTELILEVLKAHRTQGPFFAERVMALGTLLAAEAKEFDPGDAAREESRLIRVAQRALIGKGGIRPTVDEVAHRLGVSSVWLHKLFVRETGGSPGDWARAKRLAEAKRRLAEGSETNAKIALDLGYSSGQAFATAFRKESGMTPSKYREVHADGAAAPPRPVYEVLMRETWIDGVRLYPPS